MSDKCDYSMEKYGDNYCAIKKERISYDQYQDFCKRDNRESCPHLPLLEGEPLIWKRKLAPIAAF